jgi:hypothetical protein
MAFTVENRGSHFLAHKNPGFLSGMRNVILNNAPVSLELKKEFLKRPFSEQALCISFNAKRRIIDIDKMVSVNWSSCIRQKAPKAIEIWNEISNGGSKNRSFLLDNSLIVERINAFYPELQRISPSIAALFGKMIKFGGDNFYCFDKGDKGSSVTFCVPPSKNLTFDNIHLIDEKSGVPDLGLLVKYYADYCCLMG